MKEMALADFVRHLAYLVLTSAMGKVLLASAATLLVSLFSYLATELSVRTQQKKASVSIPSQKPITAQFHTNDTQDDVKFNKTQGVGSVPAGVVTVEFKHVSMDTILLTFPSSLTGTLVPPGTTLTQTPTGSDKTSSGDGA